MNRAIGAGVSVGDGLDVAIVGALNVSPESFYSGSVVLDAAVESLQECPDVAVGIEGHTDSVGPEAYNQSLGQRRADSVRGYLVSQGVPAARLTTRSYGETRPVASNDTDEGRALNRRVELHPAQ